jgi:hypothetical protein
MQSCIAYEARLIAANIAKLPVLLRKGPINKGSPIDTAGSAASCCVCFGRGWFSKRRYCSLHCRDADAIARGPYSLACLVVGPSLLIRENVKAFEDVSHVAPGPTALLLSQPKGRGLPGCLVWAGMSAAMFVRLSGEADFTKGEFEMNITGKFLLASILALPIAGPLQAQSPTQGDYYAPGPATVVHAGQGQLKKNEQGDYYVGDKMILNKKRMAALKKCTEGKAAFDSDSYVACMAKEGEAP